MSDSPKIDTISLQDKRIVTEGFAALCQLQAEAIHNGKLTLHEAVDRIQAHAFTRNIVDAIGQDLVQEIMADALTKTLQVRS